MKHFFAVAINNVLKLIFTNVSKTEKRKQFLGFKTVSQQTHSEVLYLL